MDHLDGLVHCPPTSFQSSVRYANFTIHVGLNLLNMFTSRIGLFSVIDLCPIIKGHSVKVGIEVCSRPHISQFGLSSNPIINLSLLRLAWPVAI